jgi:hypothetical protein
VFSGADFPHPLTLAELPKSRKEEEEENEDEFNTDRPFNQGPTEKRVLSVLK